MNKTVKFSLWVGGIALVSYLLYRHSTKTTSPAKTTATTATKAPNGEKSSNCCGG